MLKKIKIKTPFFGLLFMLAATSCLAEPQELYQVDVIAFMHQNDPAVTETLSENPLMISDPKARKLSQEGDPASPYVLRNRSLSGLNREYYLLKKQQQYLPLFYYSWLQPKNSRQTVKLPLTENEDWEIEGSLRINYVSYYTLDAELYFHPRKSAEQAFVVKQQQRLKDDDIYYLDHPRAGLLVKIHKLS